MHLRGELRVGVRPEQLHREPAVEAAERVRARGSRAAGSARRAAPARSRLAERVDVRATRSSRRRRRARSTNGANSSRSPKPKHRHRDGEAQDPERKLEQEEREVLPGRRVRQAGREARPPAPARRVGPVGARDLDAERAGRSACARAGPASARRRRVPTSTGMPISVIAVPKPNEIAVTRNANSDHAERQREQQVEDPAVRAGRRRMALDQSSDAVQAKSHAVAQSIRAPVPCRVMLPATRHSRRGWGPGPACGGRRGAGDLDLRSRSTARTFSYVEGSISYVRVRGVRVMLVVASPRSDRASDAPPPRPAATAISYQRPCDGNCGRSTRPPTAARAGCTSSPEGLTEVRVSAPGAGAAR